MYAWPIASSASLPCLPTAASRIASSVSSKQPAAARRKSSFFVPKSRKM